MQPADTPGVASTPPVETSPTTSPAATGDTTPPQAAPEGQPPASEGVKPPEQPQEKHVPYDRFREVNDKAKQTAEELEKARQQLAELEAKTTPPEDEAPQLDPEAQKVLDAYLKSQGFVTQEQLREKELQLQAESDIRELKSEFSDFDKEKVLNFAQENGLLINDKNGLRSVYQMMRSNDPSAKDSLRNEIIAELKESGQLTGSLTEKPGAGGPRMTPGEQPSGLRGRLHAAVQKHRAA